MPELEQLKQTIKPIISKTIEEIVSVACCSFSSIRTAAFSHGPSGQGQGGHRKFQKLMPFDQNYEHVTFLNSRRLYFLLLLSFMSFLFIVVKFKGVIFKRFQPHLISKTILHMTQTMKMELYPCKHATDFCRVPLQLGYDQTS